MPQTSSSSQARWEIAEPETKAVATTNAQPTNSRPSHGLPPPRFPKRLACIDGNSLIFDQGFDERSVEDGIAIHMQSTNFQCLQRRPASLDGCAHIFCESCIKQHFQIRAAPQTPWSTVKAAPCLTCMKKFPFGEILTWPAWQRWAQLTFNSAVVHCPNGLNFSGTSAQTADHQARMCQHHVIACPVERCQFIWPGVDGEHAHIPSCPLIRVHCMKCRLPVRVSKLATNDCINKLKAALESMLLADPSSIPSSIFPMPKSLKIHLITFLI